MMLAYPESTGLPFPSVRYGTISTPRDQHQFLVTDCTMEVGDSGGPVFDLEGRVIGMNSRCQAAESLNHQVPIDQYRKYWTSLIQPHNYTQYPAPDSGWEVSISRSQSPVPPAAMLNLPKAYRVTLSSRTNGEPVTSAGTIWETGAKGARIIGKSSLVGIRSHISTR